MTPMETRLDVIERAAVLADDLGYEVFTLPEGWALDATAVLGALALQDPHQARGHDPVDLGPYARGRWRWRRPPCSSCPAAASCSGSAPARPIWPRGFHDMAYEQPVEKLREVTSSVRDLLRGERVTLRRMPAARALRSGMPPAPEVPIWHGTVGPRAVRGDRRAGRRLAARVAGPRRRRRQGGGAAPDPHRGRRAPRRSW